MKSPHIRSERAHPARSASCTVRKAHNTSGIVRMGPAHAAGGAHKQLWGCPGVSIFFMGGPPKCKDRSPVASIGSQRAHPLRFHLSSATVNLLTPL
eukprot:7391340-Prymnesium_polylepis.1